MSPYRRFSLIDLEEKNFMMSVTLVTDKCEMCGRYKVSRCLTCGESVCIKCKSVSNKGQIVKHCQKCLGDEGVFFVATAEVVLISALRRAFSNEYNVYKGDYNISPDDATTTVRTLDKQKVEEIEKFILNLEIEKRATTSSDIETW